MDQAPFRTQVLNRSKNSCGWIQETPKYISWDKNSTSDLLWITARAGCGKTTLAAHVSEWVLSASKMSGKAPQRVSSPGHTQNSQIILFFFFHGSNQEAEGTGIAALRTLIHQLADQDSSVVPIIFRRYESLSARGFFEWSWESLSNIFEEILQSISIDSKVYIILDALDECKADSQHSLLNCI
jgi:Cdc6-like AAA superfamily ATPase